MKSLALLLASVLLAGSHLAIAASLKEDVAAATQAWVDAFSAHDVDRLTGLYDPEALLWGTVSPTVRDSPAAIRDYFKNLPNQPPQVKVVLGEQRTRVYGDIGINTGSYTFTVVREGNLVALPARFSFTYRLRDGRWLIVDHHSSAMPSAPR